MLKNEKIDIQSSLFYISILNEIRFWLLEIRAINRRIWRLI
jgi:hypothetical protein